VPDEVVRLPEPSDSNRLMLIEMDHDELPQVGGTPSGMTLSRLLDEVGGYEGMISHPFTGEQIPVSLEQWRGRDPETTWVYVAFVDASEG
jgi:hypothetical protein